jgi:hypothetical protein
VRFARALFEELFVDVEDRTMNAVLLLLMVVTAIALVPHGTDRDLVLKVAGGILLVLGAYFTARTLKQTRADQRATRMLKAIEMLENGSGPARLGAMWTLVDLGKSAERKREDWLKTAIRSVLSSVQSNYADDDELQQEIAGLNAAHPGLWTRLVAKAKEPPGEPAQRRRA